MIDILSRLYSDYYENNVTPGEVLSSHWEKYHGMIQVEPGSFSLDRLGHLRGVGFGSHPSRLVDSAFDAATRLSYQRNNKAWGVSNSLLQKGKDLSARMGWKFCYDDYRQVCSLALVQNHCVNFVRSDKKKGQVVVIGDGYGFLSGLIHIEEGRQVVLIDLGKTLLFQADSLMRVYKDAKHTLANSDSFDIEADFIYCPAEHIDKLAGLRFEWAFNIASMQEMNRESVESYFTFLRAGLTGDSLFYCCNREEKEMPGGERSVFYDYPWKQDDVHLVDELCPWHRYFLARVSSGKAITWNGMRVPFLNHFDGDHFHRLSRLITTSEGK